MPYCLTEPLKQDKKKQGQLLRVDLAVYQRNLAELALPENELGDLVVLAVVNNKHNVGNAGESLTEIEVVFSIVLVVESLVKSNAVCVKTAEGDYGLAPVLTVFGYVDIECKNGSAGEGFVIVTVNQAYACDVLCGSKRKSYCVFNAVSVNAELRTTLSKSFSKPSPPPAAGPEIGVTWLKGTLSRSVGRSGSTIISGRMGLL